MESVGKYQVRPRKGPLALFRPPLMARWEVAPGRLVNSERQYLFPDNDWTRFVPTVEVYEVPGDHDSMVLEPNVRVLASRIKRVLERAEAEIAERPVEDAPIYEDAVA